MDPLIIEIMKAATRKALSIATEKALKDGAIGEALMYEAVKSFIR